MKVIITGSRDWAGIEPVERIHRVLTAVEILASALSVKLEVVHGGCPTGADATADRWARRRGYEPVIYEANWNKYGKAAGPLRNSDMALGGGDLCIAFLKDNSRGTMDMVRRARKAGIPTFVIDWYQGNDEVDSEDDHQ